MAQIVALDDGKRFINLDAIAYTSEWDDEESITVFWISSPQSENLSLSLTHSVFVGNEAKELKDWLMEHVAYNKKQLDACF